MRLKTIGKVGLIGFGLYTLMELSFELGKGHALGTFASGPTKDMTTGEVIEYLKHCETDPYFSKRERKTIKRINRFAESQKRTMAKKGL